MEKEYLNLKLKLFYLINKIKLNYCFSPNFDLSKLGLILFIIVSETNNINKIS